MSLSLPATTLDAAAPAPRDGPVAAAPRGRASWSGLLRLSLVAVPVALQENRAGEVRTHVAVCH